MAMMPAASPAPMPADDPEPDDPNDTADTGAGEGSEGDVLLTVMKEPDGTYSLVKGDEDDADGEDTAGSATESDKQSFDSLGALLNGILDILKEDEASAGADGSSDDQFNAGFNENAPPKPAAPMAQKY